MRSVLAFVFATVAVALLSFPAQAVDLNSYRKANGQKPLRQDATLITLARAHAADMARRGTMDHAGFYAVRARRGAAAENVAYGCGDANCAMQQWINSWAHRANMLRPDFTRYGLASAKSRSGPRFWALVLGRDSRPASPKRGQKQ
jgi:uncharacterized protein YkwD